MQIPSGEKKLRIFFDFFSDNGKTTAFTAPFLFRLQFVFITYTFRIRAVVVRKYRNMCATFYTKSI